jgi:Spy/CpxP family protein refolding chaperone
MPIYLALMPEPKNNNMYYSVGKGCSYSGLSFTKFIGILLIFGLFTFTAEARKDSMRAGKSAKNDLKLNPEQREKMSQIRFAFNKEAMVLKNQMAEKRARLRILETADQADMKSIYTLIDEISSFQLQIEKRKADMKQAIRKILTPEQRLSFDLKKSRQHSGKGHKSGRRGKKRED